MLYIKSFGYTSRYPAADQSKAPSASKLHNSAHSPPSDVNISHEKFIFPRPTPNSSNSSPYFITGDVAPHARMQPKSSADYMPLPLPAEYI
mmetsp:Transcript_25441/g.74933  ORF Transcript_25441/g.74933 Transcript_25441/m.74933 type:complete len:91 (-) Transcript_25441:3005-3277(-)